MTVDKYAPNMDHEHNESKIGDNKCERKNTHTHSSSHVYMCISDKCQNTASDSVMHKLCGYFSWWTITKLKSQTWTGNSNATNNYPGACKCVQCSCMYAPNTFIQNAYTQGECRRTEVRDRDSALINAETFSSTTKIDTKVGKTVRKMNMHWNCTALFSLLCNMEICGTGAMNTDTHHRHAYITSSKSFCLAMMCNDKWITWNGSLFCT